MRKWLIRSFLIFLLILVLSLVGVHIASEFKHQSIVDDWADSAIDDVKVTTINGLEMAYRTYGNSDDEVLVLIHGFLGSSYDYRYLADRLASDYYIIAIDMVGFGHSDKPLDFTYTPTEQSQQIKALLEYIDIESYHLVGHSMGGIVTMFHAAQYTSNVETLGLIAPPSFDPQANQGRSTVFYRFLFQNYYLQRAGFRSVHYNAEFQRSEYFDPMYYFTASIPPQVLQKMGDDAEIEELYEKLESINGKILIVYGQEDTWTPPNIGEDYVQQIEYATLQLIDETGHMPMIESVDALYQILLDFYNE